MKKSLPYVLAVFTLASAMYHVIHPEFYRPLIPDFISEDWANYFAAIAETIVGVSLMLPPSRKMGGLLFMALMIGFMPIHIWDFFRDEPAMGSKLLAFVRVIFQCILIYAGYVIWKGR